MEKVRKTLSVDDRLTLLLKSEWDWKDIAAYFGCGTTKAVEIKKEARRRNGGYPKLLKNFVTVTAVFEVQGINLEQEISKIKQIKCIYDSELMVGIA